jgi:hypothetical protein
MPRPRGPDPRKTIRRTPALRSALRCRRLHAHIGIDGQAESRHAPPLQLSLELHGQEQAPWHIVDDSVPQLDCVRSCGLAVRDPYPRDAGRCSVRIPQFDRAFSPFSLVPGSTTSPRQPSSASLAASSSYAASIRSGTPSARTFFWHRSSRRGSENRSVLLSICLTSSPSSLVARQSLSRPPSRFPTSSRASVRVGTSCAPALA